MSLSPSTRFWSAVALSVIFMGAGLIIHVANAPTSFGWFAFQSLPVDDGVSVVFVREQLWGLAVAGLGALLLSALIGYRIGRRRAN